MQLGGRFRLGCLAVVFVAAVSGDMLRSAMADGGYRDPGGYSSGYSPTYSGGYADDGSWGGGGAYQGNSYQSSDYSYGGGGRKFLVISLDLDPQRQKNSSLRIAAREGRLTRVISLIQSGAEINSFSDTGDTALSLAAKQCSKSVAKYLIEHGADVNAAAQDGRTPLITAARDSCPSVASLLAQHPHIKFNLRDRTKRTALDYAMENAMHEVEGPSQEIVASIQRGRGHLRRWGARSRSEGSGIVKRTG